MTSLPPPTLDSLLVSGLVAALRAQRERLGDEAFFAGLAGNALGDPGPDTVSRTPGRRAQQTARDPHTIGGPSAAQSESLPSEKVAARAAVSLAGATREGSGKERGKARRDTPWPRRAATPASEVA